MYIISESPFVSNVAKNIKKLKGERIRFEACLQTAGELNRNKRRYSKELLESGIAKVKPRIQEGSFLGELDHPIDKNPVRQITVLYKEASHRIQDIGWDGNKLIGVLESLRTPNGNILKNLAEDGIPIGFSFRGMGDLREIREGTKTGFEVVGPLHVVTWDSVTHPSHSEAKLIKITEEVIRDINNYISECSVGGMLVPPSSYHHSNRGWRRDGGVASRDKYRRETMGYGGSRGSVGTRILSENYGGVGVNRVVVDEEDLTECDGMICTKEGICYFPNDFDRLVEQRLIELRKKYFL